ncbi:hypothetical protein OIV83_001453 [Microbotryomycetes sp. JL201]|nr:hypothetical protein OIV83_001453 [Microbotryomycetes sp. JL201]
MGSAASACIVVGQPNLADTFDPQELQRAVQAQQSMLFRDADSWQELVRYRKTVDDAWSNMQSQQRWILLDTHGARNVPLHEGLFRFKLDVGDDSPFVLASGLLGGLLAFSLDGKCVWSNPEPAHPWPHVEASEGYLIQSIGRDERLDEDHLVVWSRNNYDQSRIVAEDVDILTGHAFDANIPQIQRFMPMRWITLPAEVRATKLRYPYYLGASVADRKLFRQDLSSDELPKALDISDLWTTPGMLDPSVRYVEILFELALVAGSKAITVWDFQSESGDGNLLTMFPPYPPPELLDKPVHHYLDMQRQPMFSAVHHDCVGGHGRNVVATTYFSIVDSPFSHAIDGGKLLWMSQFTNFLSSNQYYDLEGVCVVLRSDVRIVQLSVENGRCAFIGQPTDRTFALFAFNLKPWANDPEFQEQPPRPTCLCYPLPFFGEPSRLEMTGDQIYVQASAAFRPDEGEFRAAYENARETCLPDGYAGDFAWESMSGKLMSPVWETRKEAQMQSLDEEWQKLRVRARAEHPIEGNDAFLVFEFVES